MKTESEPKPEGQQGPGNLDTLDCSASTLLSQGAYDPFNQRLFLTFRSSGRTHSYEGVPEHLWEGLASAPSQGAYFIKHIRNGGFGGVQVED